MGGHSLAPSSIERSILLAAQFQRGNLTEGGVEFLLDSANTGFDVFDLDLLDEVGENRAQQTACCGFGIPRALR